ncbi:MAG: prephenate dehydrogenase/arogenate dehydrogenase family protein [Turneriella sp.]|nr:prephenate dehydrogenase/arogenate dehydrogenase family protein [Turneriella sp.]
MKIFIWGMGLMGASLGLRLRNAGYEVSGAVRSEKSQGVLARMGFAHVFRHEKDCLAALANCDLLALGLTVSDSCAVLDKVFSHKKLLDRLIVFDMCSSKQRICDYVKSRYPKAAFVGCHPMAGKEHQGPEHADPALFELATVFMVPDKTSQRGQEALSVVAGLWQTVGAITAHIDAERHDRIMAYLSHGLHLAACLIAKQSLAVETSDLPASPAAGSYRDMTRVAESPGPMWQDIIASNSKNVADWLRSLSQESAKLASQIESGKADISALFAEAARARSRIMRK